MNDESDELNAATRDVYAHFGLAYFLSECVFQGLVNVLATDGLVITRGSVEERMKRFSASTLGPLVDAAKSTIPSEHHSTLERALERRNFLAHGFWYQRVHQTQTLSALAELQRELITDQEVFRFISDLADEIVSRRLRLAGIPEDAFDVALEQAKTAGPDPLPDRCPPKTSTVLRILRAWVTLSGGLILQDDAEELWQPGERGLCWYVGAPDPKWSVASFSVLLPATVLALPKNSSAWAYTLDFSTGFKIVASLDAVEHRPRLAIIRSTR